MEKTEPLIVRLQERGNSLIVSLTSSDLGFAPEEVWNPSPSKEHRMTPYTVPQTIRIDLRPNLLTSAKFSPPPFAVLVQAGDRIAAIAVRADAGWHRWNGVDFRALAERVDVEIDFEGQTNPAEAAGHVDLWIVHGHNETKHDLLRRVLEMQYPTAVRPEEKLPAWWLRPIYCGWGDQVAFAMQEEGIGQERRALAYCIQGLYERWLAKLDEAGVPVGTVIIDAGWSRAGVWQPDETKWPDLKGFISRQHAAGRRVLLWIATWFWDGLSMALCTTGGGKPLTADPTNPEYQKLVEKWVTELLSPGGYDADGFKIDQLHYSPTLQSSRFGPRFGFTEPLAENVRSIQMFGNNWGTELLYEYQKMIYLAAKRAKRDALINSSTVHPYFSGTFDMVRLHDMGPSVPVDLLAAMKARADLSRAALPGFPVDADNWIHRCYSTWLDYTCSSHQIGVPCIFYSERFITDWLEEPSTRPITDLPAIAAAWKKAGYTCGKSDAQDRVEEKIPETAGHYQSE